MSYALNVDNRVEGVGGGHVSGPLQQRLLLPLPPAPGADSLQLRGQEHPRLGHEQEVRGGAVLAFKNTDQNVWFLASFLE